MKIRPPVLRAWSGKRRHAVIFAGGGGSSLGDTQATDEEPYVAVNHWDAAIAMHKANHPTCKHMIEDVYKVRPIEAMDGYECELLWASPTCTHFSRAKGKRLAPETVKIRGLAWSIIPWIKQVRPEVIIVENVVEFLTWGPICHQHNEGCEGQHDVSGASCAKACQYGRPIKSRSGATFRAWKKRIRSFGYSFEYRKLVAWKYGAPTTRERVYIVMRADGQPATWPEESHTPANWRTAADIIDWSIPCASIFDRKKPHVAATRRRLAKGVRKFVLEAARPFLMHLTHGDRHTPHSIAEPVPTVTGANRGEQALVVPYMIHRSNGERPGQEPRVYDVNKPHPVIVSGGLKTEPVVAFLAKAYTERKENEVQASAMDKPIGATTAQDHHHLVAAHTIKYYGTSTGTELERPLDVVTGGGNHHGVVAASLMRYNGERRPGEGARGVAIDEPVSTLDASNRLALVEAAATEWTPAIEAKANRVYEFLMSEGQDGPWMDHELRIVRVPRTGLVIYDLASRMLIPRELFRANGFPDEYVIDLIGPRGKPLTKTEQTRMAGNVVCPDVAKALIRAALSGPGKHELPRQLSILEAA